MSQPQPGKLVGLRAEEVERGFKASPDSESSVCRGMVVCPLVRRSEGQADGGRKRERSAPRKGAHRSAAGGGPHGME